MGILAISKLTIILIGIGVVALVAALIAKKRA